MPLRTCLVACGLMAVAVLATGCGKAPQEEFQSYDRLEKAAVTADSAEPTAAPQDSATKGSPVAVAVRDAGSGDAVKAQPAGRSAGGVELQPLAEVAVAELPAEVTLESPRRVAPVAVATQARLLDDFPAIAEVPETIVPRKVELLIPTKDFRVQKGITRVSYDDIDLLKVLNMDPVTPDVTELMPDWLKELEGKRIRLRGFMYPPRSETDLTEFILARDNQICCFGRFPKPYDVIGVTMKDGVTTDYIFARPFDVVGVFHIQVRSLDDSVKQVYRIDDAVIMGQ